MHVTYSDDDHPLFDPRFSTVWQTVVDLLETLGILIHAAGPGAKSCGLPRWREIRKALTTTERALRSALVAPAQALIVELIASGVRRRDPSKVRDRNRRQDQKHPQKSEGAWFRLDGMRSSTTNDPKRRTPSVPIDDPYGFVQRSLGAEYQRYLAIIAVMRDPGLHIVRMARRIARQDRLAQSASPGKSADPRTSNCTSAPFLGDRRRNLSAPATRSANPPDCAVSPNGPAHHPP